MRKVRLIAIALAVMAGCASADAARRDDEALAASQAVIGRAVPDLAFTGTHGERIALADFRGKPLLLTLIYTGCADVCPAVIETLRPAIAAAEEALGPGSFGVLTIGFDSRNDTPDRLRSFAREHGADDPRWTFAAGDLQTIAALSDAVGFTFEASAGGFAHTAQVTVLDRQGQVYAQVYGDAFSTPAIVEPLKGVVWGRERSLFSLGGLADRVKLFCTVFDPRTGRYTFDYSLFASIIIGALCLALVLAVLVRETRRTLAAGGE
jgi:protein SCO1/2